VQLTSGGNLSSHNGRESDWTSATGACGRHLSIVRRGVAEQRWRRIGPLPSVSGGSHLSLEKPQERRGHGSMALMSSIYAESSLSHREREAFASVDC
jgi:hypothetical protein